MIKARIQIGGGAINDTYEKFRFMYISGEHRYSAPEKERDVVSYIDEAGEHVDPRTVDDVFDYKVKFMVEAPGTTADNANKLIVNFNKAIRQTSANSDVKICKTITFYDDYNKTKIVGIPEVIETVEDDDFYRRSNDWDCIVVELTIHVSDPTKCVFDI